MTRHPTRHSFNKCTWTKTLDTLRSIRCGQYKTRTADCGLWTGYKIWTRYKTRTGKYGLGIKHGLGIKRGLQTADWV